MEQTSVEAVQPRHARQAAASHPLSPCIVGAGPASDSESQSMSTAELFLIAMLIIFSVPYLVWRLGRTDHYAPLVVVQIVAGIALGPGILGAAYPGYYAFVFNPAVVQALNGIAWWAVMLFVWLAGIELDLGQAWRHRRESSITAALALGTPLLILKAAATPTLRVPVAGSAGRSARRCADRCRPALRPSGRALATAPQLA